MSREPDPLSVAEAERDHITTLTTAHHRNHPADCGDCTECLSLAAHYERAQKQVDMLQPAAEQDAMFGP